MSDTPKKQDQKPEVTPEGQERGDEMLRRMLNTPPKPHGSQSRKRAPQPVQKSDS